MSGSTSYYAQGPETLAREPYSQRYPVYAPNITEWSPGEGTAGTAGLTVTAGAKALGVSRLRASSNSTTKLQFGVPIDWRDENADIVERVWRRVGCAPLVGGHMHYAYESVDRVRVLDVDAWCAWPPD